MIDVADRKCDGATRTRNATRQRWSAATLLQIEQNFRRVRGFKHLTFLLTALTNKLKSSTTAA